MFIPVWVCIVCGACIWLMVVLSLVMVVRERKPKRNKSKGSLVIDMTEPSNPGLYLRIDSEETIREILANHEKNVLLNVIVYGE